MFFPTSQFLTLTISGLIAAAIGGLILIDPVGFHAGAGITVDDQSALLNELRAAGAALLATGALALTAIFIVKWRATALALSAVIYGSYGIGRLIGFIADGVPNSALGAIAVLEIVIAAICIALLVRPAAP